MKPKNLSEVKSQDEFLEYLIDSYYHVLGEGDDIAGIDIREAHYTLTVSSSLIVLSESLTDNDCWFADYMRVSGTWVASVRGYKDKIKTLRNKPSFEDHPAAKCFVQNAGGGWLKNIKTSHVTAEEVRDNWTVKNLIDDGGGWVIIQYGKVIGDWKQTFEKAPEKQNADPIKSDEIFNELPADKGVSNIPIEMLWVTKSFIDKKEVEIKELKQTVDALEYVNKFQIDLLDQKCNRVEALENKIAELKAENQELKTKLEYIKQSLY